MIIFLTVCTKARRPLLADPAVHRVLLEWWTRADRWIVGRYTILPDHVHLFCSPGVWPPEPLRPWVAFWKNGVARAWRASDHLSEKLVLWQRDFWDTQMRTGDSYSAKWDYVRRNPVRHGLIANAEAWPYQGELFPLTWHER